MYKNILIVSDNVNLCKQLLPILALYKDRNITFSTSPFSNKNSFEDELKLQVCVVDMKDDLVVESIVNDYDLVISMHCKQIFPPKLIKAVKCINVHPGYNPINRGWYPQVFAIINDLPIGATIHEIDEYLDHGKIIARAFVDKSPTDTSLSLYNKITEKEIELVSDNIGNILNKTYETIIPENEGNLFLKKDFNKICELNLNEVKTVGETINMLRALTHGDFKNAFFIDPISGKKVYVSINLSEKK